MAKHGRHIPQSVKKHLIQESGNICANPGCQNTRTQIHHIKHWAVYKAHNPAHMIALCPNCHDACHNGELKISDETLYNWKSLIKNKDNLYASISAPPGSPTKLIAGTISFVNNEHPKTVVFNFSKGTKLEFSVDDSWLNVSTTITDDLDRPLLRVSHNKLSLKANEDISLIQIPGRFSVTVPSEKFYLPAYALVSMRRRDPNFGKDEKITALDLQVIKPGHIRIKGFWVDHNRTVIITDKEIAICRLGHLDPISFIGGADTTFNYTGDINTSIFM